MTSPAATLASTGTATPSVLALLVVGAGAATWLRDCLLSLANQSYPRLGVLAVDDGADEESRELLDRSLGSRRILRNERPLGPVRAVRAALDRPMAKGADFILIVEAVRVARPGCRRPVGGGRGRDRVETSESSAPRS